MKSLSIVISALVLALPLAGTQAGAQSLQIQVPSDIEPARSGLQRAEVMADLQLWILSGLSEFTQGEGFADTNSYEYRKAFATYQHLRQSPLYAQLVSEFQQNPRARISPAKRMANRSAPGN